jgi:hypothetical protein
MDDARMERLLSRPAVLPLRPPKRVAMELRDMVDVDEVSGPLSSEMLRTRPRPDKHEEARR